MVVFKNIELIGAAQKGDVVSRNRFIETNLRTVKQIIYAVVGNRVTEFLGEAVIGLIRAINDLDEGRLVNHDYNGYFYHRIRFHLLRVLQGIRFVERREAGFSRGLAELGYQEPDDHGQDSYERLYASLDCLSTRHRHIFEARLNGETLHQVSQRYGISKERVRQIQDQASHKLRVHLIDQVLNLPVA